MGFALMKNISAESPPSEQNNSICRRRQIKYTMTKRDFATGGKQDHVERLTSYSEEVCPPYLQVFSPWYGSSGNSCFMADSDSFPHECINKNDQVDTSDASKLQRT